MTVEKVFSWCSADEQGAQWFLLRVHYYFNGYISKISKRFISIISVVYASVCTHGSIKRKDLSEDETKKYSPSLTDPRLEN